MGWWGVLASPFLCHPVCHNDSLATLRQQSEVGVIWYIPEFCWCLIFTELATSFKSLKIHREKIGYYQTCKYPRNLDVVKIGLGKMRYTFQGLFSLKLLDKKYPNILYVINCNTWIFLQDFILATFLAIIKWSFSTLYLFNMSSFFNFQVHFLSISNNIWFKICILIFLFMSIVEQVLFIRTLDLQTFVWFFMTWK